MTEENLNAEPGAHQIKPLAFAYDALAVRAVMRDDDPWFVASDVCTALELETHVAIRRLDEDEKGRCSIPTLGGIQEISVVNESGLYSLILGSRKASAKRFKKWVTAEVLPTIRKTGSYSLGSGAAGADAAALAPAMGRLIDVVTQQQALLERLQGAVVDLLEVNQRYITLLEEGRRKRHPWRVCTPELEVTVRELLEQGMSTRDVSHHTGVSQTTVMRIRKGEWSAILSNLAAAAGKKGGLQ